MSTDLSGLSVFVAVAEAKSFRGAAQRLGVTRSAVSQSLRRFEDRLAISLVDRTTRSVHLSEAGAALYEQVRPALAEIERGVASLGELGARPSGLLRITVSSIAESFLEPSLLASFLEAYPEVTLDLTVSDDEGDIVAAGFDAGVRLGEVIDEDMIAVAVSERQRQVVVATPDFLQRHGRPKHPRDLPKFPCIGWRPSPQAAPYRWEFSERGRDYDVAVAPRMTTNDMNVMIRMALASSCLSFGMEETFRPYLARGELVPVLERFSAPFAGFYLYYPKRGHAPRKLQALIEHLRAHRKRARKTRA
ncbi:MAG: LysR family transcriptional regulator [Polyangiaceae bacterium]